jgi:hypothetical protein
MLVRTNYDLSAGRENLSFQSFLEHATLFLPRFNSEFVSTDKVDDRRTDLFEWPTAPIECDPWANLEIQDPNRTTPRVCPCSPTGRKFLCAVRGWGPWRFQTARNSICRSGAGSCRLLSGRRTWSGIGADRRSCRGRGQWDFEHGGGASASSEQYTNAAHDFAGNCGRCDGDRDSAGGVQEAGETGGPGGRPRWFLAHCCQRAGGLEDFSCKCLLRRRIMPLIFGNRFPWEIS